MAEIFLKEQGPRQECGGCTACCTAMAVAEIDKPVGVPCAHLCPSGGGCGVYAVRPASCAGFECLWLTGWIAARPEYRPDRLGVVFTLNERGPVGAFIQANESAPGAADNERLRYVVEKTARTHLVALRRLDGSLSFFGPEARLRRVREVGRASGRGAVTTFRRADFREV